MKKAVLRSQDGLRIDGDETVDLLHVLGVNAQPPLKLLLDDLHQCEQVRIVNTAQEAKHVVPIASAVRATMRQPGNYWWLGCDLLSTGHVLDSLVFNWPAPEPLRGEAAKHLIGFPY